MEDLLITPIQEIDNEMLRFMEKELSEQYGFEIALVRGEANSTKWDGNTLIVTIEPNSTILEVLEGVPNRVSSNKITSKWISTQIQKYVHILGLNPSQTEIFLSKNSKNGIGTPYSRRLIAYVRTTKETPSNRFALDQWGILVAQTMVYIPEQYHQTLFVWCMIQALYGASKYDMAKAHMTKVIPTWESELHEVASILSGLYKTGIEVNLNFGVM